MCAWAEEIWISLPCRRLLAPAERAPGFRCASSFWIGLDGLVPDGFDSGAD